MPTGPVQSNKPKQKYDRYSGFLWTFIGIIVGFAMAWGIQAMAQEPTEKTTPEKSAAPNLSHLPQKIQEQDFVAAEKILKEHSGGESLDPFAGMYDFEQMQMRWRELHGVFPTITGLELKAQKGKSYSVTKYKKMLQDFTGNVSSLLAKKDLSKMPLALAAVHRALLNLSQIQSRIIYDEESTDQEVADGDELQEQQEKRQQDDGEEDQPWDNPSDQYKPRNKPFGQSSKGEAQNKILIETDAKVTSPLLRSQIYDTVTSERWSKSKVGRDENYVTTEEEYDYTIYTYGQNDIALPLPQNYILVSRHPQVEVRELVPGEYVLHNKGTDTTVHLTAVKVLPVKDAAAEARVKLKYLIKTGIKEAQWPMEIVDIVHAIKGSTTDPEKQMQQLKKFIRGHFKYFSDNSLGAEEQKIINARVEELKKTIPVPAAFATVKVCQCDGAAWIVAALARDFFGIPSRVVGGRTAVLRGKKVVIRTNDPAHAWAQVWIKGKGWVDVDATPKDEPPKKEDGDQDDSPKKEKEKEKDRPISNEKDDDDRDADKDGDDSSQEDSEGKDGGKEKKKKEEESKSDGEGEGEGEGEGSGKEEDKGEKKTQQVDESLDQEQGLVQEIEKQMQGSDSTYKLPELVKIFLQERLKTVAGVIANPQKKMQEFTALKKDAQDLMRKWGRLRPFIEKFLAETKVEKDRVKKWQEVDTRKLHQMIDDAIASGKLEDAYNLVLQIQKDMQFLQKVRPLTGTEKDYAAFIDQVIHKMDKQSHPDAEAFHITKSLIDNLPGPITKQWIKDNYGAESLSLGHAKNKILAEAISASELQSLQGMGRVADYTDLLLKKSSVPAYEDRYIGRETRKKQLRPVLLKVRDISDLTNAYLPSKSLDDIARDCLQEKLYKRGYRKPVRQEVPRSSKQEVLTLALVDESKSMEKLRTFFVQRLLGAFMDKSRKESSSNLKHDVIVIPFASAVGVPRMIDSDEAARAYLDVVAADGELPIMSGGTDIEAALVYAYHEIAKTFNPVVTTGAAKTTKSKVDLRKANIWLITDGGSDIKIAALQEARAGIPKDVQINLNVIFIGQRNLILERFLKESSVDAPRLIKFVSDSDINKIFNPPPEEMGKFFATNKKFTQLNEGLVSDLRGLKSQWNRVRGPEVPMTSLVDFRRKLDADLSDEKKRDPVVEALFELLQEKKAELKERKEYYSLVGKLLGHLKGEISQLHVLSFDSVRKLLDEN